MAYERVNWENLPSTNTPVNADNLNKMDEGIANIDTKINSKANTSDVYTKNQLDNGLLPIKRISDATLQDSATATIEIETNRQYFFINSHIHNRELVIITIFQNILQIDRIINTESTDSTSFTLNGNKLTIKASATCRGRLYKLSYQQAG